jgi:hypothetical protein
MRNSHRARNAEGEMRWLVEGGRERRRIGRAPRRTSTRVRPSLGSAVVHTPTRPAIAVPRARVHAGARGSQSVQGPSGSRRSDVRNGADKRLPASVPLRIGNEHVITTRVTCSELAQVHARTRHARARRWAQPDAVRRSADRLVPLGLRWNRDLRNAVRLVARGAAEHDHHVRVLSRPDGAAGEQSELFHAAGAQTHRIAAAHVVRIQAAERPGYVPAPLVVSVSKGAVSPSAHYGGQAYLESDRIKVCLSPATTLTGSRRSAGRQKRSRRRAH